MGAEGEPGILRPQSSARHFEYQRHCVGPRLGAFVTNLWTITWRLSEPYVAEVLPSPCVNLSVTNSEADVTGLVPTRYRRHLEGRGWAVGARFRPGCFRPFLSGPVAALTGASRPIAEVLGRDTVELERSIAATAVLEERVALLSDFLGEDLPDPDPVAARLAQLVEEVMRRPELVRVAQVADLAGLSSRQLQRVFAEYVGASPKWVIDRRRLQAAAARGAERSDPDWSAVAAELGFADQAHLSRAFTAAVGQSPRRYSRESATS